MYVNARPASAQFEDEIQLQMQGQRPHSVVIDGEPMYQYAMPYIAEPDSIRMSQQRQLTHSPTIRELRTWINEIGCTDYIEDDPLAVSIFRVPEFLKNTKKEAYVPQRVSLCPYHHARADLRPMRRHKGRAVLTMTKRFNANRNLVIESNNMDFANHAMEEILKVQNEIRESYEENNDCNGKTLALMLCFDGCFLLQVLRTLGLKTVDMENNSAGISDYMLFDRSMLLNKENEIIVFASTDIVNDILMLENQVPFIVLRKLLELELNSIDEANEMLLKMVMGCIRRLLKPYDTFHLERWCSLKLAGEVQHLLGFLYEAIVHPVFGSIEDTDQGPVSSMYIGRRMCIGHLSMRLIWLLQNTLIWRLQNRLIRRHQDRLKEAPNQFQRIRPAVELRNAGIKFKPCHGGISKIKFDGESDTIFLPPICITDITEVLFRNLIAFEVCRPFQITYVSCYVNMMDNLIDSEKDVALLRRMGVLTNWLGRDKEVVDLFNGLSKGAAPMNLFDAFHRLTKRVNEHYEKGIRVRLQLPKLVQDYFSTPWKALASAAAIVLLLLTLVQTIFSIISVYKK